MKISVSRSRPGKLDRSALLRALTRSERDELRSKVLSFGEFARGFVGLDLYPYQLDSADAVLKSVFAREGRSYVIIFARQSGKDELIANLILYLLARFAEKGASIVCAQPTYRPQTLSAMDRLQARASQRPFFESGGFRRRHGYVFSLLSARVTYLSAEPTASVVGATADRLLIINEAQDVRPEVYDKRFAPMAASGNATRLFCGTSWTGDTLLERERRLALQLQQRDGIQRLFVTDAEQVSSLNNLYGRFVHSELAKLGRQHPLVRTQYFCETIDAHAPMFTAAHRALMKCDKTPPARSPSSDCAAESGEEPAVRPHQSPISNAQPQFSNPTAFLLDVAGQEESNTFSPNLLGSGIEPHLNPARDGVTLRIVEIDLSSLGLLQAPTYRVVHTEQWIGLNHLTVFGRLKSLGDHWQPRHIVIDATGVGEGLWAMLDRLYPTRVIPVKFTQALKSELGYGFLAIINSGRFRDCVPSPETDRQYAACESEILIGPTKTMRWGVPDGRRDAEGRLIHDDIPVADSLTAILDRLDWSLNSPAHIIRPRDPLDGMSHFHE
jgi:hypothetical protein